MTMCNNGACTCTIPRTYLSQEIHAYRTRCQDILLARGEIPAVVQSALDVQFLQTFDPLTESDPACKDCHHLIRVHADPQPRELADNIFESVQITLGRTSGHSKLSDGLRTKVETVKKNVNKAPCAACGSNDAVSAAHILISIEDLATAKMTMDEYASEKNFIPLCGTKGSKGTCHDAFDTGNLSFVHNPVKHAWHTLYDSRYAFPRLLQETPRFRVDPCRRALRFRTQLLLECQTLKMADGVDPKFVFEYVKQYTPPKAEDSHRVLPDAKCDFGLDGCTGTVVKRHERRHICRTGFQSLPKKREREEE